MSKKISKKASTIRTVSLAVGSLSLLIIAFNQIADKEVCVSNVGWSKSNIHLVI
tara:strand:+ start:495 stop:656 length:162 start_codon:yes stop_codon:yes gene_type:complete